MHLILWERSAFFSFFFFAFFTLSRSPHNGKVALKRPLCIWEKAEQISCHTITVVGTEALKLSFLYVSHCFFGQISRYPALL